MMVHRAALRLVKSISSPTMASPGHFVEPTIREYLLVKQQQARSPNTIRLYTLRLGQFANWLSGRNATRLGDLSKLLLREWGVSFNPGWSPATVRNAVSIVNGFLNWCFSERLTLDGQLATALHVPKPKRRLGRTLSSVEVSRLLDVCDFSMFGLRDAAIVSLMVDSGLRASEVCRLKVDDPVFDFPLGDKRINFIPVIGKNGHQERAYFGKATAARLRAWLRVRVAKDDDSVFVSLGGITPLRALTRVGLYQVIRVLGNRAGIPGITPHSLRRTFTLLLDESGHTTRQIQALGRWSDIRMVEWYTQDLKTAKLYQSPIDLLDK